LTISKERDLGQIGIIVTHRFRSSKTTMVLHIVSVAIPSIEIELVFQIINAIFFFIPMDSRTSFETLESSLALRADLISFSTLILVTSSTNGEGTLVAGHKKLPVHRKPHIISTYLAYLPAHSL
jgi:hypothetical protein